jgi:hypothetical protein
MLLSVIINAETHPQETIREGPSDHGSLLLILPLTIMLHATLSTMELQGGLSKAEHSRNGR